MPDPILFSAARDKVGLSIQLNRDVMHAVVINVTNGEESSMTQLREEVVPRVKQAPGFVTGYWAWKGNSGMSFVVFESEDAADNAREMAGGIAATGVTVDNAEVREVVANACRRTSLALRGIPRRSELLPRARTHGRCRRRWGCERRTRGGQRA